MPGRVIMDPNASGRVQAVHGGRVEPGPKGLPVAGQAVRRGDVLATEVIGILTLTVAGMLAGFALALSQAEVAPGLVHALSTILN